MSKILIVDPDACTGCRMCEMACSLRHTGICNPVRSRVNIIKWEEQGINIPVLCLQCEDPFCMKVCPSGALKRNEKTGALTIDYAVCTGCKLCVMTCPIGAIVLDPVERKIVKCELCDGDPNCVRFCAPKALKYEKPERLVIAGRRKGIEKYGNLLSKIVSPLTTGGI